MGFSTGFTGGVALTLGLAYLTLRAHQDAREAQSTILRAQAAMLSDLVTPGSSLSRLRHPSRAETEARYQASLVLAAKDRWNREVESAARWAQQTDWDEVREKAEDAAAQAWGRVIGGIGGISERKAVQEAKVDAKDMLAKEEESAGWLWAAAKERGVEVGKRAEDRVAKTVEKGKEESKGWFGRARAAVVGPAGRDEGAAGETVVQKALRERYGTTEGTGKPVAEALKERYKPLDEKNI